MELNLIYFLSLAPLAVVGIFCSYTDIKYNKIFNKWIILSFIYIVFFYLFLFIFFEEKSYISNSILNGLIAFSVGYLLWYFRLWSAGDAKLFTVYAFLVPFEFYSKSYVPYFPSFNLLINLFIPILIVIIISALVSVLKEMSNFKEKIKEIRRPELKKILKFSINSFNFFLNFVFVFIILQLIILPLARNSQIGGVFNNPFFIFALLILIIGNFNKSKQKNKSLNWIIYGIILIYFSFIAIFGAGINQIVNIMKISLIFMIFVGLTKNILNFYIQKKETEKIKIEDIKEGMIPVENKISFFSDIDKNNFGKIDAGGLNKDQIKIIKHFFKNNENSEIIIYKTFPFAPFLFLSAVISIITQSSFLSIIDKFFQYLL